LSHHNDLQTKSTATRSIKMQKMIWATRPAAKADLLVDRAGGARHYPGMAQKSTDEARHPPGTGRFVNRRPP
jgi:hypothetical protein